MSINYKHTLDNLERFNYQKDPASIFSRSERPNVLLKVAKDESGRKYVQITDRQSMTRWQKILSFFGRSDYNLNNVLEVLNQAEKEAALPKERSIIYKTTEYLWQNIETKEKTASERKGFLGRLADAIGLSKPSGDVRSKVWTMRRQEITVGPEQWAKENIHVNEVPKLPDDIDDILKGPCPYFEGKKVHETWRLILIPAGLSIREIMQHRQCHCPWKELEQIADKKVERPYWALVTAEPIPASANKVFESQKSVLTGKDRAPTVLEALTVNAMYPRQVKIYYVKDQPAERGPIFTQCEETVMRQNWDKQGSTKCRWQVGGLTIDSMPDEDERMRSNETGIFAVHKLS